MRYAPLPFALAALLLPALCAPSVAGDPSGDRSTHSLLDPTPDSALRSFMPDRPLNSISPFTIDPGRLQVESDIVDFSRSSDRLTTTGTLQGLDPEIRLGLSSSSSST